VAASAIAGANERLLAEVGLAASALVESVERPMAVIGLVESDPLEATGHGRLGNGVAAALFEHFLACRPAAAAEAAGNIQQPAHAAGGADHAALAEGARVEAAALAIVHA